MLNKLLFLISIFFLSSIIAFAQVDQHPQYLNDSLLSNSQLLEKFLPEVIQFSRSKDEIVFWPNTADTIEIEKRYPNLIIGKFIDSIQTFAIDYNENDSSISFYRLNNEKWKKIGLGKNDFFSYFLFEELNGSAGQEIMASSGPNMNGNAWYDIYCYFKDLDTIKFAGDFCCDYVIDLVNKTLWETHEGSWYMPLYKTYYIWKDGMLVPYKHVRLTLINQKKYWKGKVKYKISYWENPELKYDSKYKLIFDERYNEDKHRKYWDLFFESEK